MRCRRRRHDQGLEHVTSSTADRASGQAAVDCGFQIGWVRLTEVGCLCLRLDITSKERKVGEGCQVYGFAASRATTTPATAFPQHQASTKCLLWTL